MSWKVERSETFDRWWKKEGVDDSNYRFYEAALVEFQNIPLPHNVQTQIFKNKSYECWVTRQPDKARKRGKSGGFRVVLILDLEEKRLILQGIFRRDNLGYKGSPGKRDGAYGDLIDSLAVEFIEAAP
jgi:mRNA-degrading endonuclease RelE of RelBE toxin-antitoxin system